ncbi:helix-turn-helix transcriptional regulator [Nocardioides mangrovi]|uniref:Helix-turn-helix transcriptional regulator n=1 Tax=Nocardioides mangrovi TaxID=2874580 RepID=A0ABS7UAT7_9ACTN|nr:helix-turn-helix transcriptional regulator [Nocardioides mangrovi]MBZ5737985.1 helix-turn-helix transcriptional regulator [Nocardioides mangrovi]
MSDEQLVNRVVSTLRSSRPSPVAESVHQAVLDAAAALQVRRSALASRLAAGRPAEADVVGVGPEGMNAWMARRSAHWRTLLSTRPNGLLEHLRVGLPLSRVRIRGGTHIETVYDYWGLEPAARVMVANETLGIYRQGHAPLQMSLVDDRFVLLHGPEVDGQPSLMATTDTACLAAARHYWDAARASTFEVPAPPVIADLSPRQRQVVALLSEGHADDVIATSLEVSIRTVRTEVAAVLATLGVRSRFAAGTRLQLADVLQTDDPPGP